MGRNGRRAGRWGAYPDRVLPFLFLVTFEAASWMDLRQAANDACRARQWDACAAKYAELDARLGGPPNMLATLARAQMQAGGAKAALATLERLAKTGLALRVDNDPSFRALKDDPRFQKVVETMRANATPRAAARLVVKLPAQEWIAEDLALDGDGFLVSSVRKSKIVRVRRDGSVSDFAATPYSAFALQRAGKRLWVSSAAIAHGEGFSAAIAGKGAVLRLDPKSGRELARFEQRGNLGDLTVAKNGDVFVTDSTGGGVFRLRDGKFEALTAEREFLSPQTPALAPGEKALYVPDYPAGIARLDLATRQVSWLKNPQGCALTGIDGMYAYRDSLLAIQNGTSPKRILRLRLAGDVVAACEVLEQNSPGLGEPSHGVLAGRDFYFIANAGWDRFDDNGKPLTQAPPEAPEIRVLRLPD